MNGIYWFRKALRLHDNPALSEAVEKCETLFPLFILDPSIRSFVKVGANRWRFLVQSLQDLDRSLREANLRLIVIRGTPKDLMPKLIDKWKINLIAYEMDTEPFAIKRDQEIDQIANKLKVELIKRVSHTLYDPNDILRNSASKSTPFTYQGFLTTLSKMGSLSPPLPVPDFSHLHPIEKYLKNEPCELPTLEELGIKESECGPCLFPGGETEAIKRMEQTLSDHKWVVSFAKPNTSPNSLKPSTTVLSPYLKFGCLSCRRLYFKLKEIESKSSKCTQPPVSLVGQLLWREFFYANAALTPNFDKMVGNPICKQIEWDKNDEHLKAWKEGRTGYPFIDAIMIQLKTEGWIHHLARHAVACFLTRGDLWISWEDGLKVFEEYLLDADWSLNAGNWLWLSASAFFHQYFRVYSPISFGKKTDPNGDFIRKYIPVLRRFPKEHIYEPWKAPKFVQQNCKCLIGVDYPKPIVDHETVRKINLSKMAKAYANNKAESIVEETGDVLMSPKKKKKI
ncbi:cryptochrome-2-like protein [Dinothrombium tinctorium]|uniref:Cryptochrome-2-like protein n=1 Tax=Dinothrombium tinctorium TaxID=1965070 RepID=A0A3S3P1S4_9ACAR|nr:cryptochrome-2-like protein [Dinothrombium tinctorium]